MRSTRGWLHATLRLPAALLAVFLCLYLVALAIVKIEPLLRPHAPDFYETKPLAGEPAPEFVLRETGGTEYRLSEHVGPRPIVIWFGSVSCPYCTRMVGWMNQLATEYEGQVDFVFVYCDEAHPHEVPPTKTMEERGERATQFATEAEMAVPVLVDDFGDRSVQRLYGSFNSSAFVVGRDGRLLAKLPTAMPPDIEKVLQKYLERNP